MWPFKKRTIEFKISQIKPGARIPQYQTDGSCAFDLHVLGRHVIAPRSISLLPTGLVAKVPEGYALLLVSRSSVPKKLGLTMPHGIGIIDQDYCGPEDELKIQVYNMTNDDVVVEDGSRICQGLLINIAKAKFKTVAIFGTDSRGGFGSTGS